MLTRLGLMGLLDAARQRNRRRDIVREIGLLAFGSGRYRGSREELVPQLPSLEAIALALSSP